jgi:DNA-binding protein HU-beta
MRSATMAGLQETFMHKTDLIDAIAAKSGLPKGDAAKALEATLQSITDALIARDTVTITGFGVFKPKDRPQREGRNPRDGSTMTIAASTSVGFSVGAGLKSALNGGNGG